MRLIGRTVRAEVWHGSFVEWSPSRIDVVAVDPPWRQRNLSYWSNKAGVVQQWPEFVDGMIRLVNECSPYIVYFKVGSSESGAWISRLRDMKYRVVSWPTAYGGGTNVQIVASKRIVRDIPVSNSSRRSSSLLATWVAAQGLKTVVDPCAGKGEMLAKFARCMHATAIEIVEERALQCAKRLNVC